MMIWESNEIKPASRLTPFGWLCVTLGGLAIGGLVGAAVALLEMVKHG